MNASVRGLMLAFRAPLTMGGKSNANRAARANHHLLRTGQRFRLHGERNAATLCPGLSYFATSGHGASFDGVPQ